MALDTPWPKLCRPDLPHLTLAERYCGYMRTTMATQGNELYQQWIAYLLCLIFSQRPSLLPENSYFP